MRYKKVILILILLNCFYSVKCNKTNFYDEIFAISIKEIKQKYSNDINLDTIYIVLPNNNLSSIISNKIDDVIVRVINDISEINKSFILFKVGNIDCKDNIIGIGIDIVKVDFDFNNYSINPDFGYSLCKWRYDCKLNKYEVENFILFISDI
jgi:hypothetical protein